MSNNDQFQSLEKRYFLAVTPLPPPTNLLATPSSSTAIKLNWTDNASSESGFKIDRSPDGLTWTRINEVGANVTTYTNGKLTTGKTYYFRVRAFDTEKNSIYSNVANAKPQAVPSTATIAAPTNLKAAATSSTAIKIDWTDNANNETGYRVERSTDGVNFKLLNTVGAGVTTYTNGKLITGTKYYFRVKAFNLSASSAYSNIGSAVAATPPSTTPKPSAPTSLTATSVSGTSIQINWTDNANNETGYRIERSTDGANFKLLNTIGANEKSYLSGKLTTGLKYYFRVCAFNDGGSSAYSNVANATPVVPVPPPLVDANELRTVALSTTSIRVLWKDNSIGETGYKVERSTSSTSGFTQVATLPADSMTYNDTGLSPGKKYYYRVRPYNDGGNGPYSNVVGRTTLLPGQQPNWASGGKGEYATGNWYFDGVSVTLAADPVQTIPLLKDLHVGSVRIWFNKSESWNPVGGDGIPIAKAYHDAGFRVMMVVGDDIVPTYEQAKTFFQYVASNPDALKYVDMWEIGNEPNIWGFWKGTAAEYVNLVLKPAYEVFSPLGEYVVGAGPTWDVNYAKKLVTEGYLNYVDYANFHPYGSTPEEVLTRATGARDAFAGRPILFSEWNIRNTSGLEAWAAKVDSTRKLLATGGFDSAFYFTYAVANTLAGPAGLVNLEDYSANQPFYDMFRKFGDEPIVEI